MQSTKHIGIVAVSGEGAALCYRTIVTEGAAILGRHAHPEVSMHTIPLSEHMRPIEADRWEEAGELLLVSARKLASIGAEILICPDNTAHQGLDLVREKSPVPWLHIAEEVGAVAAAAGYKRLGITGTRYLMEGPVYRQKLAVRGIGSAVPDAEERFGINTIIFDELVSGHFTEPSREYLRRAIRGLAERGCDAVVLGCTEIPLLIAQEDSPIPVIDSTRTLARAALREATKGMGADVRRAPGVR
ncbi:MAG TPA: amino acid racemase [Candidatus Polarisedimenticolaceae bacterium]|nr:amino acid racemase [Candidatus Polarisedimenticolaceae bacterium]